MILRGRERQDLVSGCHADKTDLLAFKKLFDDKASPCSAEALIDENLIDCSQCLLAVFGNNDAFARCEPVCLQHQGGLAVFNMPTGLIRVRKNLPGCGGNGVAVEEGFGETLGAFELGGSRAGSEAGEASILEAVDDAVHQRGFRPDHREINPAGLDSVDQRISIVRRNRQVFNTRLQ